MSPRDFLLELASELALSPAELVLLVARAPYSYKSYPVDKKSGNGKRIISQPARQTKHIQNALLESILKSLPVHECASAYQKGSSIKKNALAHAGNAYLSKFDIVDFFGSISEEDLIEHFKIHLGEQVDPKHFKLIARCCTISYKGANKFVLSVGAPTSPLLSNSIMHEFDTSMQAWCLERGITYTRYADDLTFSTNTKDISFEIEARIVEILKALNYPRLQINQKKTVYASRKNQRRVTGLIISNEGSISLGRDKKRVISAMIHRFTQGKLPEQELAYLQGIMGLAKDVEPLFLSRMRAKYGVNAISSVLQYRAPPKEIKPAK